MVQELTADFTNLASKSLTERLTPEESASFSSLMELLSSYIDIEEIYATVASTVDDISSMKPYLDTKAGYFYLRMSEDRLNTTVS